MPQDFEGEHIHRSQQSKKVQSISSVKFDEYFGFTDKEVLAMLEYYGLADKHPVVKKWYDGYKFGNVSVYCPWDVVNYISDLEADRDLPPQNYWVNSSSNDIIRTFLDKATDTTKDEIENLIEGNAVVKKISEDMTYSEQEESIDNLWSVLYTTGYLTKEKQKEQYSHNMLALKIPNEEVRDIFKEKIQKWFQSTVENNTKRYTAFCQAFLDGATTVIESMFDDYLGEMISIRDSASRSNLKENFYHGFLLGILNFRTDWIVKSNREGGLGYNDILIMHRKSHTGMIIEVKYATSNKLKEECQKAQDQIDRNHYSDALRDYEPQKVYKYAFACYKKHSMVTLVEEDWETK